MKFSKIILIILVILNSCKNEKKPELFSYLQSTQEIINFCKAMIPCVKEEIQQVFKDQPQQREYLLSKTNHTNCKSEQSEKLSLLLNLTNEQIQSLITELNRIQIEPKLINLQAFLEQNQNKILEDYTKCSEDIIKANSCLEKKQILKNNPFCKNIFN